MGGFWCERTAADALFHIFMDYGLIFWPEAMVSSFSRCFLPHKTLTDGLEWCGLLVDYCNVFISCLDSHSDGTHSLQSIHWWASDVMLNFSKSVPMNKQIPLHLGWPEGECIFSTFSFVSELFIQSEIQNEMWGKIHIETWTTNTKRSNNTFLWRSLCRHTHTV